MDINAKNVAAVTTGPVHQTNYFGGTQPPPLPSSVPSSKGFVGRQTELDSLNEAKRSGKTAFVLHGQAGVGKTELALRFIEAIKPEFQAHVRLNMRGLEQNAPTATDMMLEVIRAFDPTVKSDLGHEAIQNLYVQLTNQHKSILLLDNAKDRAQVEPLNHANVFLVVTSRDNFNLSGGFAKEIEQMSPADAIALLYAVAGEARFAGRAEDFAALTGYLPMALLPLASVFADDPTLEVDAFLKEYEDRKKVLRLTDPNRNVSVAASLDLSYERLTNELKRCWRLLAVFPGGFDLRAMAFVSQTQNEKAAQSELVRSHLLIFDAKTKRLRLHDLAREHAYSKLNREELLSANSFHAAHYGILFTEIDSVTFANLAVFDLERTNIETGFSFIRDKLKHFAELCTYYTGYASDLLFLRMPPEMVRDWQEVGLAAYTKLGNRKGQAYSLNNLGRVCSLLDDYDQAIDYYTQALKIVHENGEKIFEATWLGNLGNVYLKRRDSEGAIKQFERAIKVAREIGDKRLEGRSIGLLGNSYAALGEYDRARGYLEEALTFEGIDIQVRASVLASLGQLYVQKGRKKEAIGMLREALETFEKLNPPYAAKISEFLSSLE